MNLCEVLTDDEFNDSRIVEFDLTDDKTGIEFIECCDNYFKVTLSRPEVERLINALKSMHSNMRDAS